MASILFRALSGLAAVAAAGSAAAQDLAIADVTVVDVRTGALAAHRTVVIRDGRIASVDAAPPPAGARIVSERGRYLVPGYRDMVTHLSWARASALPALVANGVTAVRDQGGDLAETAVWAQGVRSGRLTGPSITQVGPMLNGKSFNRYQFALGSPEAARGAVRLLKAEGVDGLEIERRVPRDVYQALMAEAHEAKLPVGGKVPLEVTPAEASTAGQATIDNLETLYDGVFRAQHAADVNGAIDAFLAPGGGGAELFATFRRNGTAVTPVLAALSSAIEHNDPAAAHDPHDRYVARSQRQPARPLPAAELAEFRAMLPRLQATVRALRAAGVTILAGTDLAADRVPGLGLHAEFDALAAAGLTPLEVLQSTTLNAARVTGQAEQDGTVAPGQPADLVLLETDPMRDVAALHRIAAVVLHGRWLDRADLDALLAQAATLAEAN